MEDCSVLYVKIKERKKMNRNTMYRIGAVIMVVVIVNVLILPLGYEQNVVDREMRQFDFCNELEDELAKVECFKNHRIWEYDRDIYEQDRIDSNKGSNYSALVIVNFLVLLLSIIYILSLEVEDDE